MAPIRISFNLTMPFSFYSVESDRKIVRDNMKFMCVFTFIISCLWIGFLTYILVWMIVIIAHNFNISESIIGITLMAFGSSVPDTYSSLVVVRKGQGDMAICHSIGSNTFDLLIGLGLPWIAAIFYRYMMNVPASNLHIQIYSPSMVYSCLVCILSIIIMWSMLYINNWTLKIKNSLALIFFYLLFVISAIFLDIYVFPSYGICQ